MRLPRWLTARRASLGALICGAATLAFTRVDGSPGVLPTAVLILAAWAPMALRARRPWVQWIQTLWVMAVVLLHLAWWTREDVVPSLPTYLGGHYAQSFENPLDGSKVSFMGWWTIGRVFVGFGMAGLFTSFAKVWRAFDHEWETGVDGPAQVTVIAAAWLALAGCIGAVDAFTRPDRVLLLMDRVCAFTSEPPPTTKPAFCQDAPSRISAHWHGRCNFCRDLTRPALRRTAGWSSLGVAGFGLLLAVGTARRLRRRTRWIERVGDGSVEGWSLAYYTPAWGKLNTIPRLVGDVEPENLATTCLVVRRQDARDTKSEGGYRDPAAVGAALGRLDATPWMGGLNAARRGEQAVRPLLRMFAVAFAVAIVPMTIASVVLLVGPWN